MLNVTYAECHLCWMSLMLNVTYAECHLCWMSLMLNVTYAECHLCWMSPTWMLLALSVTLSPLCWVSLCWVMLCWVSLWWVSLCWVSLCWVSWRLNYIGKTLLCTACVLTNFLKCVPSIFWENIEHNTSQEFSVHPKFLKSDLTKSSEKIILKPFCNFPNRRTTYVCLNIMKGSLP
jgi:hypothetical protein